MKKFFSFVGFVFPPLYFPYFVYLVSSAIRSTRISGLAMTGVFAGKIAKSFISSTFYSFVFFSTLIVVVVYCLISVFLWISDIKLNEFVDEAISTYAIIYALSLPFVFVGGEILETIESTTDTEEATEKKDVKKTSKKEDEALLESLIED